MAAAEVAGVHRAVLAVAAEEVADLAVVAAAFHRPANRYLRVAVEVAAVVVPHFRPTAKAGAGEDIGRQVAERPAVRRFASQYPHSLAERPAVHRFAAQCQCFQAVWIAAPTFRVQVLTSDVQDSTFRPRSSPAPLLRLHVVRTATFAAERIHWQRGRDRKDLCEPSLLDRV